MDSRDWLYLLKRWGANGAVAFLLAVIFQHFAAPEDKEIFTAGLFGVAIYVAAGVGISVVQALGGFLYLIALRGGDMKAGFLKQLRTSKLPPPAEWQVKRFDYLLDMADDPDADPSDRVKAAVISATYDANYQHAGFFKGIALAQAADEATLQYSQEAPRK